MNKIYKILFSFGTLLFLGACERGQNNSPTDVSTPEESPSSESLSSESSSNNISKYILSFSAGEASEEKIEYEYESGETLFLPENTFAFEGYDFAGWKYGETTYNVGDSFTMPESNIEMVAQWTLTYVEPAPSFSQTEYEYDKLGGANLELPFDLDGAGLFYVELNGEILETTLYSFDEEKSCIVINSDFVLSLDLGKHTVTAITDAETEIPVSCILNVTQSLKTSFDKITTKEFIYGKDQGVTFEVGYNTTTPVKLMQGEKVIDEKYYSYDEDSFTISSDWLSYYCEPTSYSLYLSNNDVYEFSVNSNIIFATDYDINTIHDTTASNLGHNPLYQYYDAVSIVDGIEGMEGHVLKIKPNTVDVTYDCHGYITLRNSSWDSTWREGGFVEGKYYVISFDYMTEGTTIGEFNYGSANKKVPLLLGAENDGVVRNTKMVFSYDEIGRGVRLWAKFVGGSGNVYIDNFKIAQLDEVPTISANSEYSLTGDYQVDFDSKGYTYEVIINKTPISADYDEVAKKLIISEDYLLELEPGKNTIIIRTTIGDFSANFSVVDRRISVLSETTRDVVHGQGSVKLAGEFAKTLSVTSITRYGADATWDKTPTSLNTEYIVVEPDGLVLSSDIVDLVYKTTRFVVELSNGKTVEFSLNSNIRYYTDYDQANVFIDLPGNSEISQDRKMWSRVDVGDGDYELKYEPSKATQTHAVNAINGNGFANSVLSFYNKNVGNIVWYGIGYTRNDTIYVTFEYKVVTNGKDSCYGFSWWDAADQRHFMPLSGEGTFEFIKPASEVGRFSINCPAPTPDAVKDTCMYIDKYAVGWYTDPYLTQTSANVTRGGEAITLEGTFENDLTVTKLTRFGTHTWDNSKKTIVEIDKTLISLAPNGLVVSKELIDKVYDTATFVATLSNEKIVRFTLTSNTLYYSDFDLFSIHNTSKGNINTCQDTAMWTIIEENGNKQIKYMPANATLSHAVNGAKGNGCFTFSNTTLGNTWWHAFAFDTSKKLVLFFDYEVVLGDKQTSYYQFNAIDTADVHHNYNLTGSGTFTVEIDLSQIKAFRINCPSGNKSLIDGTYMTIDNFGFAYKV